MSPRPSTQFGEPLSEESLSLVRDVRQLLTVPRHPNFDTDFNVYRFVACAERAHRGTRADLVQAAARALDTHLRVRQCLRLDELEDVPLTQNRLFRERLMPLGSIVPSESGIDAYNRLLWYVEYATMSIEKIAHGIRSSESVRCQIWQFEHMLRLVNQQEQRTGKLSAIRHVVDMTGFALNPFSSSFVYSGTLSYYSQLFHYENYPELIYPIELVNIARWVQLPYRMIKGMMPAGFTDRFRLHDANFLQTLRAEIPDTCIPASLGGAGASITCVPASPLTHAWVPEQPHLLTQLQSMHIGARRVKCVRVHVPEGSTRKRWKLSWYFRTDGDIFFGVFYEPNNNNYEGENDAENKPHTNGGSMENNGVAHATVIPTTNGDKLDGKDSNTKEHHHHHHNYNHLPEQLEWVYPWFKLSAKYHHEWDCVDCSRPGTYLLLFSNKHSWLHRRSVDVCIQLEDQQEGRTRRILVEAAKDDVEDEVSEQHSLRASLQMAPEHMFGPATPALEA